MKKRQACFVYIVCCSDGTLYTGCATDVAARVEQHNRKTGAKYTRSRLPVKLLYEERLASRAQALRREYKIKQLTRAEKLKLART